MKYNLVSFESGEIAIGFNDTKVNTYSMVSEANTIVEKGSDIMTFYVSTTAKDWTNEGDFYVYVIISENPHESSWTPLDRDKKVLTFN